MFRKLNPAMWEWQTILAIGAFVFTFAVFVFFFIRALRMKKPEADRLATLPVEDDTVTTSRRHEH
jgi:heme/copper-type cytochrome/quinol oxidase subunit 1